VLFGYIYYATQVESVEDDDASVEAENINLVDGSVNGSEPAQTDRQSDIDVSPLARTSTSTLRSRRQR
jgi:hypothetical protein